MHGELGSVTIEEQFHCCTCDSCFIRADHMDRPFVQSFEHESLHRKRRAADLEEPRLAGEQAP